MAKPVSINKGLYWNAKGSIWKAFGMLLYEKRDTFLVGLLQKLKEELDFSNRAYSTQQLLDIGCGTGDISERISKIFGIDTVGVDLYSRFISKRETAFLLANSYILPFRPKSFEIITAFSLLEHIEEKHRIDFFDAVHNVLADNGTFVIQLPNRYFLIEQHSFLPFVGYLPSRFHRLFYFSYVNVPSKGKVIADLARSGFVVKKIVNYGIPFQGFPLTDKLAKVIPFGFLIIAKMTEI